MEAIDLKITNDIKHLPKSTEIIKKREVDDKEKLAKAAKDFESILTSMMLKSMTKTTEGIFGGEESFGGNVLDMIFETEMASFISKTKGLGIAEMIYGNMTGDDFKTVYEIFSKYRSRIINYSAIDRSYDLVKPNDNAMERLSKYENIIEEASKKFNVDKNIIKSVILTESAANEQAISKAKAKGLMQLIDETAKSMGVNNIWDPKENIFGGTKYLSEMLKKYNGDLKISLAAYNAGPGNVDKYSGIPPFEETQNYVKRVMGYLNHFNGA